MVEHVVSVLFFCKCVSYKIEKQTVKFAITKTNKTVCIKYNRNSLQKPQLGSSLALHRSISEIVKL